MFTEVFKRREFAGVIVNAGCPEHGLPPEPPERRSSFKQSPASTVVQIATLLGQLTQAPIFSLLENDAAITEAVRKRISTTIGTQPVYLEAARFGWVKRARLYWLTLHGHPVSYDMQPAPIGLQHSPADAAGITRLVYSGKAPIPERPMFEGGYKAMLDPLEVMAARTPPMHQFAREE